MRVLGYLPAWLSALAVVRAAKYSVKRTYDASNFFDEFFFRSAEYYEHLIDARDPTNGAVDYLSKKAAISRGLASTANNQVRLSVDSTSVVDAKLGRPAVRLEGKKPFDKGLLVADIEHMPGSSCGTWPAFWTFNFEENPYGEVDILEGTSQFGQSSNMISLHTCGTCHFKDLGGIGDIRPDCNLCGKTENDSGCGVEANLKTYGSDFNSAGGGIYATLYAEDGVTIWFFPRKDIPHDLLKGTSVDPSRWTARPVVRFKSGSGCHTNHYFKNQTIIINTTFCGDNIWDWELQAEGQCGPTNGDGQQLCANYVATHPEDYKEAYWLINSIKLYQA